MPMQTSNLVMSANDKSILFGDVFAVHLTRFYFHD